MSNELTVIQSKDLSHLDELLQEVEQFEKNYSSLIIKDENDKEGYESVRAALSVLRPRRTALDKERIAFGKPYREAVTAINQRFDTIISRIEKVEDPLKSQKTKVDRINEERLERQRFEAEQKINNRIDALIKNGCVFDGSYYSISSEKFGISESSIGVGDIRSMSDELFEQFLLVVTEKHDEIARKEHDEEVLATQKAEAERAAAEQRERELKEKEDLLNKRLMAIEEAEKALREAEEKKVADTRNVRFAELSNYQLSGVSFVGVENLSESEYKDLVSSAKINHEAALMVEQKNIEEAIRAKMKLEAEAEALKEAARIAELGDKEKWKLFILELESLKIPVFNTPSFNKKVKLLVDCISQLTNAS